MINTLWLWLICPAAFLFGALFIIVLALIFTENNQ